MNVSWASKNTTRQQRAGKGNFSARFPINVFYSFVEIHSAFFPFSAPSHGYGNTPSPPGQTSTLSSCPTDRYIPASILQLHKDFYANRRLCSRHTIAIRQKSGIAGDVAHQLMYRLVSGKMYHVKVEQWHRQMLVLFFISLAKSSNCFPLL